MVILTSLMALSTLVIAPTFAAVLPNIETRDVAEPHFFGRDLGGLFAREQEFELPADLVSRFWSGAEDNSELVRRDVATDAIKRAIKKGDVPHSPFNKHEFLGDPERDLSTRDVIDDDLFERFFDDLD